MIPNNYTNSRVSFGQCIIKKQSIKRIANLAKDASEDSMNRIKEAVDFFIKKGDEIAGESLKDDLIELSLCKNFDKKLYITLQLIPKKHEGLFEIIKDWCVSNPNINFDEFFKKFIDESKKKAKFIDDMMGLINK